VAVPTEVLWERDPHTAAKHKLLRRYQEAWFPIMASQFHDVGITFFDGFAGPGEYTNSQVSSPVIAVGQSLRSDVAGRGTPIRLVFIERDRRRAQHLENVLEARFPQSTRPPNVVTRVHHGVCADIYEQAIEEVGGWAGPVFANLDGWGVDADYEVVQRIAQHSSSEVLVTFEDQFFIRFADGPQQAGERVFGHSDWRSVGQQLTPNKSPHILELYRQGLREAGFDFVLTFDLVDEGGHSLRLFFGTTHHVAVRKFKDAMWEVDYIAGQRFRDPRDPNQLSLDIREPDLTPLKESILRLLKERGHSMADLRSHALLETIFREPQVADAVSSLCEERKAEWRPPGGSNAARTLHLAPESLF